MILLKLIHKIRYSIIYQILKFRAKRELKNKIWQDLSVVKNDAYDPEGVEETLSKMYDDSKINYFEEDKI